MSWAGKKIIAGLKEAIAHARGEVPARITAEPVERAKEMKRFTKCPHCGSTEFRHGPAGGACENIECDRCGARFNVVHIPGGPYLDRELRPPQRIAS